MKIIFDFDDTLFNSQAFKQHIFSSLTKFGIASEAAKKYYLKVRGGEFSLKQFLKELSVVQAVPLHIEAVYQEIMEACPNYINNELVAIARNVGKANCFIVTYGEKEFNLDKVRMSGIGEYVRE